MEHLIQIALTVLLSLVSLVVCFPLAILIFILVYGDKGRDDPSRPPLSRWQLLTIFVCKTIPRMFAVFVLRQPLTAEEEAHYARMREMSRADTPASESPEPTGPLPERETRLTTDSRPPRGGVSRYAEWLRQRRRRTDKTDA